MEKKTIKLALDLETTGFDADNDSIIEVGMVKFDDGGEIERWSSLVRYKNKLPDKVADLTGIDDEELKTAPEWSQVKLVVAKWLEEAEIMVGHNIAFDVDFLRNNGITVEQVKLVDTWYLANMLVTGVHSYSLEALSRFIKWEYNAHRALEDTLAVVGLYQYLEGVMRSISDEVLAKIIPVLRKGDWVYAYLFEDEWAKRQGNYCISRSKMFRQVKIDYHPQNFDGKYVVAELNRREVIQSMGDRDWLVISRDEFDYWSNFDLSGFGLIDEQRKYLCRHKLRDLMKKIKLQDVEIGILVKIILQIEKYWDGHLSRLNLLDKEWEIVRSLRCGDEGINHADCFYENKFCSSGKKVMTWPVLEELKARGKTTENLWYWVNDETLEDGMTELTEVRVGRWLWEEMFDDLQVVPGMRRSQLDGLRKQMEMMWGMAGWLIKSQGVDNGMTQGLDFTPTLYQDLSVVPVVKVVKDILRQWEDMNPVGWKQNLRFGFRNMHIFLKNWLGQGDWMMSGKIINGELSFSLSKINFRDLLEEKSVERLILAAPVVFFAEKMYAYRLFFDQQETMKMAKSWDVRLEIDYRQSGEVIDLDNLDELPNSLLVFSSRDKGEDWLEKIKDKPYYGQVNNLLVGRKNLMAKLTGWSVINFHNLRYLRKTLNQFDQIYLDSLPFDVPDSLSIGYRSIYYGESSFQNYYLPRMYNRLFGLVHFIKPGGQLVVGDSRLWEKEYGKKIIEVFNDRK